MPASDEAGNVYKNVGGNVYDNIQISGGNVQLSNTYNGDDKKQKIMRWLSAINPWTGHRDALEQYQEGSVDSFFRDETFLQWPDGGIQTLWCPGSMGAGKTVLMSAIIDHIRQPTLVQQDTRVAFIYFRYAERKQQTMPQAIGCILNHSYSSVEGNPELPSYV